MTGVRSAYNSVLRRRLLVNGLGRGSCYSTRSELADRYELEIYISNSLSPYFNLAYEDYLFQKFPRYTSENTKSTNPKKKTLFLYTNARSVIIGRNQNPWREVNVDALRRNDVPLLRRKSGGGTVYHDVGNINYSVIMPGMSFDRDEHAKVICDALNPVLKEKGHGTTLSINERHDIVNQAGQKVSGSAYKIQRGKAYHHGTMLLNTKLDELSELLHSNVHDGLEEVEGPGVQSVKSPVSNIGITNDEFRHAVVQAFADRYAVDGKAAVNVPVLESLSQADSEQVTTRAGELKSWKWTFGSTPMFTHKFLLEDSQPGVSFTVKEGSILGVDSNLDEFAPIKSSLVGLEYKGSAVARLLKSEYWKSRLSKAI